MPVSCKLCLFKAEFEDEQDVTSEEHIEKILLIIEVFFNGKIFITREDVPSICVPCKEKLEAFYSYYLLVLENQVAINDKVEELDVKCEVFVEPIIKLDATENEIPNKTKIEAGRKSKRLRGVSPEFTKTEESESSDETTDERRFSDDEFVIPVKPKMGRSREHYLRLKKNKNPFLKPRLKKLDVSGSESEGEDWKPSTYGKPPQLSRSEKEAREAMIQKYFGKKCDTCGDDTEYVSYSALSQHCKKQHNTRKHYICCETLLSSFKTIYEHCLEHENPVQCNFCGMLCVSATMHRRHLYTVHGISVKKPVTAPFECDLCKRRYISREKIELHMERSHLSPEPQQSFVCETCARAYKNPRALDIHIRRDHLGEKLPKSQCPHCHRWLLTTGMPVHLRKHLALQPTEKFKCDKCGSEHTAYYGLLKHQTRHHSEKSNQFKCSLCPKGFYNKKYLREHFATHTGEILYPCEWCESGFKSMGNYLAHKRKLHTELYNEQKRKRQLEREAKSRPY
ncbi:zinc finger protein 62 homolog [Culicoides brevitarsis]|uniref:zinc finger protein 62 homolog n=1 Tax=Culicoides brevitarsis TaxID=469753 RepID=UPI00307C35CF